jgi:hypothetical protein
MGDEPAPLVLSSEQTEIGCFVSGSYRDDCERFVEELKQRLVERARPGEHFARA